MAEEILDTRELEEHNVDIAHMKRLNRTERARAAEEAEGFVAGMARHFSQVYLHLDVQRNKEQTRGVPAYHWKALLVTDNGRYYAEEDDFGALEALKATLAELEFGVESRISRLQDQSRSIPQETL